MLHLTLFYVILQYGISFYDSARLHIISNIRIDSYYYYVFNMMDNTKIYVKSRATPLNIIFVKLNIKLL